MTSAYVTETGQDPRIRLALSILGHADLAHWQQARDRAVLALEGATIEELQEMSE